MKISLEKAFETLKTEKHRKVGRYSVSDVWAMTNGYLPPEKFLEQEPYSLTGEINKFLGIEKHESVQKLLKVIYPEGEEEFKTEHDFGSFVVVGKVDFMTEDVIIEIKTSLDPMFKSKSWHDYQLKWYLWLLKQHKGYIVQPMIDSYRGKPVSMYLNVLKVIYNNPMFIDQEIGKLEDYHNKLTKINK